MATASGTVAAEGDIVELVLHLTPSADVAGVLVRADSVTRVPYVDLAIIYQAPSGLSGAVKVRTSSTGPSSSPRFRGSFVLVGAVPSLNAVLRSKVDPAARRKLELGSVALDEAPPFVTRVTRRRDTLVPVGREVTVSFSEPMDTSFAIFTRCI